MYNLPTIRITKHKSIMVPNTKITYNGIKVTFVAKYKKNG